MKKKVLYAEIDEKFKKKIEGYCKKHNLSKTQATILAFELLLKHAPTTVFVKK